MRFFHFFPWVGAFLPLVSLWSVPHRYDHVVIVVEENRTVGQIIGDTTNAPYINTLANGGVSMARMFAIEHPSQPNYMQMYSGANQGVEDDGLPPNFSTTPTSSYPFTAPNLGAELIASGFSFAGYSEQIETAGSNDWADYDPHTATNPGVKYRRKHSPWVNWVAKVAPVPANQLPASANKAFTQFPSNFATLPTLSFVIPNQDHDMHDGSRKEGDTWLQQNLDAYAQWAKTHNSLLVITWDEDDYNATNQIATIFYGAGLRNGTVAGGTWTLHNLLRTFEDMYGSATHAGSAAQVKSIVGPFADDPLVTVATFRQGTNGYTGAKDTQLFQASSGTNFSTTQDITVDKDTSSSSGDQAGQVLIRFENLFGSSAGQIPANAVIHSAKLILNTPNNTSSSDYDSDDAMRAHRMIRDWSDTATWDSLSSGVAADGIEAATTSSFSFTPEVDGAPMIIDVTDDIEDFQAGIANRGWLLRASSSASGDGWTLKSSESSDSSLRPSLEVVYSAAPLSPYAQWVVSKSLSAAQNQPTADPDGDGVSNQLEYALNLHPLVSDGSIMTLNGTTGLPMVVRNASGTLEITFVQRKSSTHAGLSYQAQFSETLAEGTWVSGTLVSTVSIDASWERVTVRDTTAAGRRYARLQVTMTP